ncbi:MAG: lipid A biosynthesis lauroyl acyltransferase [Sulfurovum sp.]|nr:lipid A biosynthesis lauroyl acyltransferase [Sulfurovum sp.]
MLDYFYLALYTFFKVLLKVLPSWILRKLMTAIAWLAWYSSPKHKNRIKEHLTLAWGTALNESEQKEIGIHAFMNLLDTVFGILKRDGMDKQEVLHNITFEGSEIIEAYQKANKNFILVTGHYGNWELLSQSMAIKFDLTLVGVGRKIDSAMMDEVLKKNREQFNVEMIYKKGALKESMRVIKEGKTLGILTDQALRPHQSIEVQFFNQRATHTPLASILSRKFGLDLIPAYISTEDYQSYTVKIYEPIVSIKTENQEEDLAILTQKQADITEKVIRKNPKQWFWMHRRWK